MASSEARLIRAALCAIPIIFCVVFYTFQMGSRVLVYFENYIEESYIGIKGELTVTSPSSQFLTQLYDDTKATSLLASKKQTTKTLLGVRVGNIDLVKGFDVLVYQREYLNRKFDDFSRNKNALIINTVVENQLGIENRNEPFTLYDPNSKVEVTFSTIVVVDLGFLTSESIAILAQDDYEKLFKRPAKYNQLEFHDVNIMSRHQIALLAQTRFEQGAFSSYKILDVKTLTSEHQQVLGALQWLSYVLIIVLVTLNLLLSILAVKTVIKAKQSSINTMKLLGMTSQELWGYLIGLWVLLLLASLAISNIAVRLSEDTIFGYIF